MKAPTPWEDFGEHQFQAGDVFQIMPEHGRKGWVGALVYATKIRSWGIVGFVAHVVTHDEQQRAFIRLKWVEIEHLGRSPLSLEDDNATQA